MRCICLFVLLLAACSAPVKPGSALFTQDSGFIRKNDVLNILKYNHLTDTTASGWTLYPDTDTFGKYYRQPDGNIMACLLDVGSETHLLTEITTDDSIVKAERYIHWNYPCCWRNFDGFVKHGDYYCLKICRTGSGYCSSNAYIFKNIQPQDSMSYIMQSYFDSFGGGGPDCPWVVTSKRLIKGDSILMQYQVNELAMSDTIEVIGGTTTFEVTFFKDKEKWRPTDSTFLKMYKLDW
ncbi:hypothetical protein [Chitinophaga sp. HK235]|uniref:hypothetical protein n=1 Tax=Chitinophaga sp. HK235 TaxID=2952571 RepID=UPI001BA982C2|nr:hypothetical protein [Chitinophaga sp. HK235]